jgi:hypothetical protein
MEARGEQKDGGNECALGCVVLIPLVECTLGCVILIPLVHLGS